MTDFGQNTLISFQFSSVLWCILQNDSVFFITHFAAAIKKQKGEPVMSLNAMLLPRTTWH